jgi:hypothetical protein
VNRAARAAVSLSSTGATLTPAAKDFADDDDGRVMTTTLAPSAASACHTPVSQTKGEYVIVGAHVGDGTADDPSSDDCETLVCRHV